MRAEFVCCYIIIYIKVIFCQKGITMKYEKFDIFEEPGKRTETEYLRSLAEKLAERANSQEMKSIVKRWSDTNGLRKPDRMPVYCKPVGCWSEILPENSFYCKDPLRRMLEINLKKDLIKVDIDDDNPFMPYLEVGAVVETNPENKWGVDIGRHSSDEAGGAWGYDPPLKTPEDIAKLKMPEFSINKEKTEERVSRISDEIGGILPVKLVCSNPVSATLGTDAADLVGLTELMMNVAVEPEMIHALMAHLRDACLKGLDFAEESGLMFPNNNAPMSCSDPVGEEPADGRYTAKNSWCMPNSQEFDQVSPEMWEEFCLDYQKPIIERFGLSSYGCCENLTNKIDGVLSIPNLRVFVCSAWTNLDKLLEKVDDSYVIMWRQKASDVVFPDSDEKIKADLMEGASKLKGRNVQIVLRELETLSGHPDRLHVWTRYAKEAASLIAAG